MCIYIYIYKYMYIYIYIYTYIHVHREGGKLGIQLAAPPVSEPSSCIQMHWTRTRSTRFNATAAKSQAYARYARSTDLKSEVRLNRSETCLGLAEGTPTSTLLHGGGLELPRLVVLGGEELLVLGRALSLFRTGRGLGDGIPADWCYYAMMMLLLVLLSYITIIIIIHYYYHY